MVIAAHRSRLRDFCFSNGVARGVLSSLGIIFVTVLYGRIIIWGYFVIYSLIATEHGHQILGGSWDIRLTYTMPIAFFFLIVIAVLALLYEIWIECKRKISGT